MFASNLKKVMMVEGRKDWVYREKWNSRVNMCMCHSREEKVYGQGSACLITEDLG